MKIMSRKIISRYATLVSMAEDTTPRWKFLTNHAQVLVCIADDPGVLLTGDQRASRNHRTRRPSDRHRARGRRLHRARAQRPPQPVHDPVRRCASRPSRPRRAGRRPARDSRRHERRVSRFDGPASSTEREGRSVVVSSNPGSEATTGSRSDKLRVVIAGGGVAALETALALADLASDCTDVTVIAPNTEFVYRPMSRPRAVRLRCCTPLPTCIDRPPRRGEADHRRAGVDRPGHADDPHQGR